MRQFLEAALACCCLSSGLALGAEKKFTPLDLQSRANQKLTDNFGSGREGNNLVALPKGEQVFEGVPFKIEDGLLQLGSTLLKEEKPDKVEGIPVGRTFDRLHILHATGYGNGSVIGEEGTAGDPLFVPDGTLIGEYQVNYEDGTHVKIPIVYGQDVRDWWFTENVKGVTRGKVAWKGENELGKSAGSQLRLYLTTWDNPKPNKKVLTLDYLKGKDTPAAPFCVAMTLEGNLTKATSAGGKWEYKVVRAADDPAKMEEALNHLGQEGWECVGTVSRVFGGGVEGSSRSSGAYLICKRPKR